MSSTVFAVCLWLMCFTVLFIAFFKKHSTVFHCVVLHSLF